MCQFSLKSLSVLPILFFFLYTPSIALFSPSSNIVLFGDSFLNNNSITLTRDTTNCTPSSAVGRAFYVNPVRFLDPLSNTTSSFSCNFTFTITNNPSCPFGDGLAFVVASNVDSFTVGDGFMGLPEDSYFAVEFDTSFNQDVGDINDNHVGVDLNTVKSLAAVDVSRSGVSLKDGKKVSVWIEYRDLEKRVYVWVGSLKQVRPKIPVIALNIDLSLYMKEFMRVGFTASNGRGSSIHTVEYWRFRTFTRFLRSAQGLFDSVQEEGCLICSPEDLQIGSFKYSSESSYRRIWKLALVLVGFTLLIMLIAAVIVMCLCMVKKKRVSRARSVRHMRRLGGGGMVPNMLSLNEIKAATNGFNQSKIIGEGASAVVYEGEIGSCGTVAIKRFNHEDNFDSSRIPFNTELATMVGCLKHKNLVQLQGWCCEKNELVLVYEHMANGSLDRVLHSHSGLSKFLTWERRFNILQGVAAALIYLHEECESQIIHRDVKSCNILLDSQFNAKLGDFGLAEVYKHSSKMRDSAEPAGTLGYLAPEYLYSGVPTMKTDVYSFGVVVLEVATGRKPVNEGRIALTDYVWGLVEKGRIGKAADPKLMGRYSRIEMERTLMVGLCCVHFNSAKRPTMREAARMLRGDSPLPVLPLKRPTMNIHSVMPENRSHITSLRTEVSPETPWSTPKSHFSKY